MSDKATKCYESCNDHKCVRAGKCMGLAGSQADRHEDKSQREATGRDWMMDLMDQYQAKSMTTLVRKLKDELDQAKATPSAIEAPDRNMAGAAEFVNAIITGQPIWPNKWGQDVALAAFTINRERTRSSIAPRKDQYQEGYADGLGRAMREHQAAADRHREAGDHTYARMDDAWAKTFRELAEKERQTVAPSATRRFTALEADLLADHYFADVIDSQHVGCQDKIREAFQWAFAELRRMDRTGDK